MRKFLLFILLLFALQISAQEAYTKGDVFIDVQTGASFIGGIIGGGVHYGATPRFSVGANFSNQSFNLKSKYYLLNYKRKDISEKSLIKLYEKFCKNYKEDSNYIKLKARN